MRARSLLTVAALTAVLASASALLPIPAQAASRVGITNDQGTSTVDPTYATTVTVSGSGFQSIKGGHGGIYVFFGTVSGQWRPSKGGQTGTNLLYVPDSETQSNQGFQKFVAFPGSDTAGSANGGEIKADGSWSTSMVVPGATFNAADRDGKSKKVDCRTSTCGIITIGAHGVKNARNETFTPVSFADLYDTAPATTATQAPSTGATSSTPTGAATTPTTRVASKPALTVDPDTAVAGRVMSFNAVGLNPGDQVVASFDEGVAAVGPLNVGPHGQVAGVVPLPLGTTAGTHTLRLTGTASAPTVNFPVAAAPMPAASAVTQSDIPWASIAFASAAFLVLLTAMAFTLVRFRTSRQKTSAHAV